MIEWSKVSKQLLKELDSLEPKDRLGVVGSLVSCNLALARSVNGWTSWLVDARIMNLIDEKELKTVFEEFRSLTRAFLKLDVKVTEKYAKEDKPKKNQSSQIIV